MIWWLAQAQRAQAEREAIALLREQVAWLGNVTWRLAEGMHLAVDFDIAHAGESFPLTMIYAAFHPYAPPIVVPRDGRQLSQHQYPGDGNLCLEYRSDNWVPSITGAMMVESAYRLISGERGQNGPQQVPSAHSASIGQTTRAAHFRFLVSPSANDQLRMLIPGQSVDVALLEKNHADAFVITMTAVNGVDVSPAWMQEKGIPGTWSKSCRALRVPTGASIPSSLNLKSFTEALAKWGFEELAQLVGMPKSSVDALLVSDAESRLVFVFDSDDSRNVICYRTIAIPEEAVSRHDDEYAALAGKRIGIVGCGSLGSKIAASLARSGVRQFTLVDDDIVLSGNLVRNELGQLAVGTHKVAAVEARLKEIVGGVDVRVRRVALGGQESADTTESVMSDLAVCDLLIDATADAQCFNFCAAVAKTNGKPLLWAEVFGGGIGGIVARVRPGMEPEPQSARNQIFAWCEAQDVPAPGMATNPYEGQSLVGAPLIADDSEVAVIAAHCTRFAIDALVRPDDSIFPASAYAIGLRAAWLFRAPFDACPIEFHGPFDWSIEENHNAIEHGLALLRDLVPEDADDDNQSAA